MKHYAAHYVWSAQVGLQKQFVVVIADEGHVHCIFPLTEEIESVEWYPGIICLWAEKEISLDNLKQALRLPATGIRQPQLYAHLLYPFDFTSMQLVDETRHKLLL